MLDRIALSMLLLLAAADEEKAPPKPEKPAATQPTEEVKPETLDNGRIQYLPPAGWTKSEATGAPVPAAAPSRDAQGRSVQKSKMTSTPNRAIYISDTREGMIMIEVPPDMTIGDGTAKSIVKSLRAKRQKAGTSVMDAKEEPDDRFDIRIHEQYKQGSRVSNQLHLYKQVGSRVVMVTINSLSDDEETTKAILSTGEAVLVSAKLVKPQRPAPSRPAAGAKRRT